MRHARPDCYILTGPAAETFAQEPVSGLAPVLLQTSAPATFTRLDSFDHALRRSGRLLLDLGTGLELMLRDGAILCQPVPPCGRFVADLPEGPVKQALADLSPLRSLLPCGAGSRSRSSLSFADKDQKTRCRAMLHVFQDVGGATVTLVTLQALHGGEKALADLRRRLKRCGVAFNMRALHRLLFPDQTADEAKPKLALTADQTAFEAATQIIAQHLLMVRQTETGILADLDTEFLHDHRVALRKVRSVPSLFKGVYQPARTADLKARFLALMAQTGPLRDLDVLLLDRQACYNVVPSRLHAGLDALFALRRTQRSTALAGLCRHLRSQGHAQEMAELTALFTTPGALEPGPDADQPAYGLARQLIWKRFQKARRIALGIGPDTPDSEIHALRIQCKKLRYLMEFFAGLFPQSKMKPALKTLKNVQDHLGLVNDLSVQLANLESVLLGERDNAECQVAQSVTALAAVLRQRLLEQRGKTLTVIAAFASVRTKSHFRALFRRRTPKP